MRAISSVIWYVVLFRQDRTDRPYVNGIERFPNLDSFILYSGIAPVEKGSGNTIRYRQNHGGNRQLNNVLYIVALVNLQFDPKGKAYYQKKLREGKTKKHVIRCLMQRIATIIYGMLKSGENYQEDYQKLEELQRKD